MSSTKRTTLIGLLALTGILAGCQTTNRHVSSQQEAASVHIAVTQVAPWEEYVAALSPDFDLSAKDALGRVVPRTSAAEYRDLRGSSFGAELGLATDAGSLVSTITRTTEGGETTESKTSTAEDKEGPPELPTAAGSPVGDRTAAGLAGLPGRDSFSPGTEPVLAYSTATALYQEVKLLERYVRDAALRSKRRPYIARVQLSIFPTQRDLPLDIQTNLGFFSDTDCDVLDNEGAVVVPLLVTDGLESTLTSTSLGNLSQIGLALKFLESNLGGNVSFSKFRETVDSLLSADINSFLTLGRITDNVVAVRLGAARQGRNGYAMLPRTHNITVLVLTPDETEEKPCGNSDDSVIQVLKDPYGMRVVSSTSMRYTDGERVTVLGRKSEDDQLVNQLEERFDTVITLGTLGRLREAIYDNEPGTFEAAWTGTYNVTSCANAKSGCYLWRDAWNTMAAVFAYGPTSAARFQLPPPSPAALPVAGQTLHLLDQGVGKAMSVVVQGATGLADHRIQGTLTFQTLYNGNPRGWIWRSTAASYDAENERVTLTFPSISESGLVPLPTGLRLQNAQLEVKAAARSRWSNATQATTYPNLMYRQVSVVSAPWVTVTPITAQIAASKGKGDLALTVKFPKANGQQLATQAKLTVGNAILDSVKGGTATGQDVIVTANGRVTLTLSGLAPGAKVTIKAEAQDANKKSVGPSIPTLSLEVKATP